MLMFRDKLRVNEPMNQAMQELKDDDLRSMARHIAKLPPPEPSGGAIDTGRMERARALIEQHRCNFCHQGNFSGEQNVPRLAVQREDYLAKACANTRTTRGALRRRDGECALSDQRWADWRSRLLSRTSALIPRRHGLVGKVE